MADLSSLYPYIMPELPGCPDPIVDRVIVDSVREFCRRTDLLRNTENLSILVGEDSYSLSPPVGNEVLDIKRVYLDGIDIPLYREDSGLVKINSSSEGESIIYYTWKPQDTIVTHPIPSTLLDNTLDVDYSYQPLRTATTIPDEVFDRWAECLAAKVKSILMRQAGKSWSNPEFVGINNAEWWRLLGDARSESFRMYGNPISAARYSLDQG